MVEENKGKEEHNFSCSRNLIIPVHTKKKYFGKIPKKPREKKGYYVDKNSLIEGINPVTGYPYRRYILVKIRRD